MDLVNTYYSSCKSSFSHLILDKQEALVVIIYYLHVFYNYWVNAA